MALRLIKIVPPHGYDDPKSLIDKDDVIDSWIEKFEEGNVIVNLLAEVEYTEKILGDLETEFKV